MKLFRAWSWFLFISLLFTAIGHLVSYYMASDTVAMLVTRNAYFIGFFCRLQVLISLYLLQIFSYRSLYLHSIYYWPHLDVFGVRFIIYLPNWSSSSVPYSLAYANTWCSFFFFFFWITHTQVHTLIHSEYCPGYFCSSFRSGHHQISLDFRPLWKKRSCSFCSEINLLGPQDYFSEKNYRNKDKMKDLDYGDHKIYFSKTLKWDGNILIVISRLPPKSRLVSGKLEV